MKNLKQANINTTLKKLFKYWLEVTRFIHGLTEQQMNILSLFLYYHYKLKSDITNEKILWKMVFDYDTKSKIKEELNIKDSVLQNTLTSFRKKGVIQKERISSFYIPELELKSNNFKIIFNFNIINGPDK